jgi:Uma2 family endonuclease
MADLPRTGWTVDMLAALPDDGNRYEIIDGELFVTSWQPGPGAARRHRDAVRSMFLRLHAYLTAHPVAQVRVAAADLVLDSGTTVQPDVFVVPLVDGYVSRTGRDAGQLLLAVEVVSPSSAHADRVVKRRLYQQHGVPNYWIVDVDARLVERWRPGDLRPEILEYAVAWQPNLAQAPLVIDLPGYFSEVWTGSERAS